MKTLPRHNWIWVAKSYLSLSKAGLATLEMDINVNRNNYTLCAIVFNVKHAIELIIKTLLVTATTKYDKNHNLRSLSMRLKKQTKSKSKTLDELISISEKYHGLDIFGGVLKKTGFVDTDNDAFRYPFSHHNYALDLQLIKELGKVDILEIKTDIAKLEKLAGKLYRSWRNRNGPRVSTYQRARWFAYMLEPKARKSSVRRKIERRTRTGQSVISPS